MSRNIAESARWIDKKTFPGAGAIVGASVIVPVTVGVTAGTAAYEARKLSPAYWSYRAASAVFDLF